MYSSTSSGYGNNPYPNVETQPDDSLNPYSASKAGAEHMVRTWNNTYGLPYLITSAANNYGPRQHSEKLIPKVIDNALNNRVTNMYGGGQQIRDWIYVEDHCRAIWTLDEQNILNDKFNISAGHELPNIEVTKKILDMMEKKFDKDDVLDAISNCAKLGVLNEPDALMLGMPGETDETVEESANFIAGLRYTLGLEERSNSL